MKIIFKLSIFVLTFILYTNIHSQPKSQVEPDYFSSITIGAIEGFSFSLGKYFIRDFSLAVKWTYFGVEGKINTTPGVGIGANYFTKRFLIFNYLSTDFMYLYGESFKGYGIEFVVGSLNNKDYGFEFVYELGIGYSNTKAKYSIPANERGVLLGPIIKIGLNYNF